MKMKNEFIGVDEVRVHARTGADLSNCLKECVIMAFTEWRDVRLTHNDREYLINPERILQALFVCPSNDNGFHN